MIKVTLKGIKGTISKHYFKTWDEANTWLDSVSYDENGKRFEIVVEENKIRTINAFKLLTFDIIESDWKNDGFKQIKKLTVRQNNEKDV